MRIILMLIKKEFLQVFRSPLLMSILIVAPMVQFILFPFTADYEIKVLDIAFIDNDNSTLSRQLIEEFSSSTHFRSKGMIDSKSYADKLMKADKIDFLVEIPLDFEKNVMGQYGTTIAITASRSHCHRNQNGQAAFIWRSLPQRIWTVWNGWQKRLQRLAWTASRCSTVVSRNVVW